MGCSTYVLSKLLFNVKEMKVYEFIWEACNGRGTKKHKTLEITWRTYFLSRQVENKGFLEKTLDLAYLLHTLWKATTQEPWRRKLNHAHSSWSRAVTMKNQNFNFKWLGYSFHCKVDLDEEKFNLNFLTWILIIFSFTLPFFFKLLNARIEPHILLEI